MMDETEMVVELYLQLVRGIIEQAKLDQKVKQLNANRGSLTLSEYGGSSPRYHRRELSAFYDPRLYPPPPLYPTASLPLLAQHSAEHVP